MSFLLDYPRPAFCVFTCKNHLPRARGDKIQARSVTFPPRQSGSAAGSVRPLSREALGAEAPLEPSAPVPAGAAELPPLLQLAHKSSAGERGARGRTGRLDTSKEPPPAVATC